MNHGLYWEHMTAIRAICDEWKEDSSEYKILSEVGTKYLCCIKQCMHGEKPDKELLGFIEGVKLCLPMFGREFAYSLWCLDSVYEKATSDSTRRV
jgi:hypothetical protein